MRAELQRATQLGKNDSSSDFAFGDFSIPSSQDTYGRDAHKPEAPPRNRKSLQHDKMLRAQIREAEAEANAAQLAAWGLMPAEEKKEEKKDKKLPDRFEDQKGRIWNRGERVLGKGAFGEVFLGMGSDGGLVAVKTMRLPALVSMAAEAKKPEAAAGGQSAAARRRQARKAVAAPAPAGGGATPASQVEDLLREVALMQSLRHDNVVAYLGSAVVSSGHIMIVMEYLSGGSLSGILGEFGGKLAVSSIQRYVRDSVRGLAFLRSTASSTGT